jgi:hypothetical protein
MPKTPNPIASIASRIGRINSTKAIRIIVNIQIVQVTTVRDDTGENNWSIMQMYEKEAKTTDDLRDLRGGRTSLIWIVELGMWIGSLFLAAIALLCWSLSILLTAFRNGPSFDMASTTPPIAVTNAVIAIMIFAISVIRIHHLENRT